jgi:hypothetical protein
VQLRDDFFLKRYYEKQIKNAEKLKRIGKLTLADSLRLKQAHESK